MKNIYQAIIAVMEDVGAVGKEKTNKSQGFKYRGIDDVMNALNPAFIKNKLFMVPEVLEQSREERNTAKGGNLIYSVCKVKYTFYAEDGSSIEAVVVGEGMDSGDKASNKALAAAFKYACFQTFCIPTEDLKDPDEESPEVAPKRGRINEQQAKELMLELIRLNIKLPAFLQANQLQDVHELTEGQWEDTMAQLKNRPKKRVAEDAIPWGRQ